jgi:hypothetical protein
MTIELRDTAEANLRFIRGAMERAERNSSVSGLGGMVMGVIALIASAAAAQQAAIDDQLSIWLGAAVIASIAGAAGVWFKAHQSGASIMGDAALRFLLCMLPVLLTGGLLTRVLWTTDQVTLLPAIWMLLYGCGLTAAGTYAAKPIMPMGFAFLFCGAICAMLGGEWSNLLLAVAFGGLHLFFGYQVYRHHGG